MSSSRVAVVVLAAGSSSRLGRAKQLVEFEGLTLIRRTVQAANDSQADGVVVTTTNNGVDFEAELQGLQWTRAHVDNPHAGQSESLRAGLLAVEVEGEFDAILFTPCDLPLLSVSHLDALVREYRSGGWDIVASRYDEVSGAPLIVGRALWPELKELHGDVGARKIIPLHAQTTTSVEWPEGRFDVDTPDDLATVLKDASISSWSLD